VHRLFLRIFCWFWLTALVIIAIGLVGRQVTDLRTIKSTSVCASVAPVLAVKSARVFETEELEAFARFASKLADGRDSQLYLLDGFKNDVQVDHFPRTSFALRTPPVTIILLPPTIRYTCVWQHTSSYPIPGTLTLLLFTSTPICPTCQSCSSTKQFHSFSACWW